MMTGRTTNLHELHPPGDRLGLQARVAEQLIQATDPTLAGRALFDLIAANLRLNAFFLYVIGEGGLDLIAHGGVSEAEAAAARDLSAGNAPDRIPLTSHTTSVQELEDGGATFLKSIGLKAWFGQPLMAGDRLLGVIGFGRRWTDRFDDEDLCLLKSAGKYLALALERLRGEAALSESEKRLQLGMAIAGFRAFDHNLITGAIILSPESFGILGLSPGQAVTPELLLATHHPEDRERTRAARLASYDPAGTGEYDEEHRVIRPDGAVRWLHVRAQSFFAGEGNARRAVRAIGAIQDVTEAKLAEQFLRENEQRMRLAMETAGFGTFDYDVATDEHIWSPELRAIYGIEPDAVITIGTLVRLTHPDDQKAVSDALTARAQKAAAGDFADYSLEHRIVRLDGELRWISVRGRMLFREQDGERQRSRYIGIIQDITHRKLAEASIRASEERLQMAQELGGVASWDWDIAGEELWVSEGFRQIHGLPPHAPVTIGIIDGIVHPEDRERTMGGARRGVIESGGDSLEFRIIRPSDREIRWIQAKGGIFRDGSGTVRLVGISLDITERKRDQERERLLTAEVDHRAKNLLAIIKALLQLTRASSIPEFVEQIKGRVHALGRVHSLLAASRWNGAELSKLIWDELAPFASSADRFRLTGPSVELKPAAAQSMALVFHELTTNAVKHGALSVPGGRVDVAWETGGPRQGELLLHWRESGGPTVVAPQHGGFGMNVVRDSVEFQLGATVDIRWRPEGLEYELTLPCRQLA